MTASLGDMEGDDDQPIAPQPWDENEMEDRDDGVLECGDCRCTAKWT